MLVSHVFESVLFSDLYVARVQFIVQHFGQRCYFEIALLINWWGMWNTGRIYRCLSVWNIPHRFDRWRIWAGCYWFQRCCCTLSSVCPSLVCYPLWDSPATLHPLKNKKHRQAGLSNTSTSLELCHTSKTAENHRDVKYSKPVWRCFVCFMLPCSLLLTLTLRFTYAQAGPFDDTWEHDDPFTIINSKSEPFSCKNKIH